MPNASGPVGGAPGPSRSGTALPRNGHIVNTLRRRRFAVRIAEVVRRTGLPHESVLRDQRSATCWPASPPSRSSPSAQYSRAVRRSGNATSLDMLLGGPGLHLARRPCLDGALDDRTFGVGLGSLYVHSTPRAQSWRPLPESA